MTKPYRNHLSSSKDLETTYESVRAGFVSLALEKNKQATPYVEEARTLGVLASKASTPIALLEIKDIQSALLTAAGISDKAKTHLLPKHKKEAIVGLVRNFLEPAGKKFVEELVYRFLLIKGDTLGGSMRNIGGILAQRKFTRSLLAALRVAGTEYCWLSSEQFCWAPGNETVAQIEDSVKAISWSNAIGNRTLIFNINVPRVGNNIDLCLLGCGHEALNTKKAFQGNIGNPRIYLALGELKGGIDPAGADEHWKTARTALSRINEAFSRIKPKPELFFVGAAIETKMSADIWEMLRKKLLANAANLTDNTQMVSMTNWICSI